MDAGFEVKLPSQSQVAVLRLSKSWKVPWLQTLKSEDTSRKESQISRCGMRGVPSSQLLIVLKAGILASSKRSVEEGDYLDISKRGRENILQKSLSLRLIKVRRSQVTRNDKDMIPEIESQ